MPRYMMDVEWKMTAKVEIDAPDEETAQELLFDMDLPEGEFDFESLEIVHFEEAYGDDF